MRILLPLLLPFPLLLLLLLRPLLLFLFFPFQSDISIIRDPQTKTRYEYDRVFAAGSSQLQVFESVQPLCVSVLDGFNVCIFAYGQTGSGKVCSVVWCGVVPGLVWFVYSLHGIDVMALQYYVLYYVLFILEQYQLNPLTTNITVIGNIETTDELIISIKKYIKNIHLAIGNKNLVWANITGMPQHYNYSLVNRLFCE